MSILIKGMEMPRNCWECHFGNGETGNCLVDFKSHGEWDEPQNCPLVPVPPHGRLIDADALKMAWDGIEENMHTPVAVIRALIDDAPTFMDAER